MTDLATLVVRLEAETSQYQTQLAAATKQLKDFQNSVTEAVGDLATQFAALFTVDKIADFIEDVVASAAAIDKLSQSAGVGVEQLGGLGLAYAAAGLSQDEMSASLKHLNTSISDAAGSATSKAAYAFQALGVSVTNANGSIKSAGDLLPEIADAYAKLADGPSKVAINTDLLGRSATNLIPLLNGGSEALADFQAKADALGITLSGDVAAAAEELETKFTVLKQTFEGGFGGDVLVALLPTLTAMVDGLQTITASGNASGAALSVFTAVLKTLGVVVLEIYGEVRELGSAFTGAAAAVEAAANGQFKDAWDILNKQEQDAVAIRESTGKAILDLINADGIEQTAAAKKAADSITAAYSSAAVSVALPSDAGAAASPISPSFGPQAAAATGALANFSAALHDNSVAYTADAIAGTDFTVGLGATTDAANAALASLLDLAKAPIGVSPAQLQAQDEATKKIEEFSASIEEQTKSFGQGSAAATSYKLATGALGDAIALANKNLEATAGASDAGSIALHASAAAALTAASAAEAYAKQLSQQEDTKEITAYTDKLQEQVDKLNLGSVAAAQYAETHGKLGKAITDSGAAGQIAAAQIDNLTQQIVDAANQKGFAETSVQVLELQGNLVQAADAAYALQLKLNPNIGGSPYKAELDNLHALTDAQKAYQEQVNQTTAIEANEALLESQINAAVASGQTDALAGAKQIADARTSELGQLQAIYDKMQTIANGSGIPTLVNQAKQFGVALNNLQTSAIDPLATKLKTDFTDSASDAFASFVTGTETASQAFHQFLTSFESDIAKIASKNLLDSLLGGTDSSSGIFGMLASFLEGGSSTSVASGNALVGNGLNSLDLTAGVFGGGLASGGPVQAGSSYIVGEHGAEAFVPNVDGTIVPNSKMSKGTTIVQNFVLPPGGNISRQTQQQTAAMASSGLSRASRRNN